MLMDSQLSKGTNTNTKGRVITMKRKFFKGMAAMLAILTFISFSGVQVMAADDTSNVIYPETQRAIDDAIANSNVEVSYFDNIVSAYLEYGYSDMGELNDALINAADSIKAVHQANEIKFQKVYDEYLETVQENNRARSTVDIDTYNTILNTYSSGILLVRAAGCPHTADAMAHAIVPYGNVGSSWHPSDLRYDDDDWARYLFTETGLWAIFEGEFQKQMWPNFPAVISVGPGEYEFTKDNSCLDAFAQLHDVDYSATFVKNPNDPYSYSASFYISDTYDFEWSNYDNFAISFGNNYAASAQNLGIIAPFKIYCTYHM